MKKEQTDDFIEALAQIDAVGVRFGEILGLLLQNIMNLIISLFDPELTKDFP